MRPQQLFEEIYTHFPGIQYSGLVVNDEMQYANLEEGLDPDDHEALIMRLYFIANDPEKDITYFITQYSEGKYLYFVKVDEGVWLFILSTNKSFAKLHFYVKFLLSDSSLQMEEESPGARQSTEQANSAKRIQDLLLPNLHQTLKAFSAFDLLYRPVDIIGGDFYWAKKEKDVTWLAIGDCTGHAMEGALASVSVMSILNQLYDRDLTPHMLIKGLHQSLANMQTQKLSEGYGIGCEMMVMRFDHRSGELTYSGTGIPLYYQTRDGKLTAYRTRTSTLDTERVVKYLRSRRLQLVKGDEILTFSDGLKDQLNPQSRRLPRRAIMQALKKAGHLDLKALALMMHDHQQDEPQTDDIVAISLKV